VPSTPGQGVVPAGVTTADDVVGGLVGVVADA
jgi:hypothetical protein